jgi:hypothetical protein
MAKCHSDLPLTTGAMLRWLLDQDVPFGALHYAKHGWVFFQDDGFDFADIAEQLGSVPALIFTAQDGDEVVDLVAWQPSTGTVASWLNVAFALGEIDQITNPATYFDGGALHIHETPLQWLQAGCEGIVVMKPEYAAAHLRGRRLFVASPLHAMRVEHWCRMSLKTEIITSAPSEESAAA